MNRNEWEAQIWASKMNQTAKFIALTIGSHGNWEDGTEVRPSVTRLAGMCSVSRDTVTKYVEALEEQGWIKHVRTLKNNVKEYRLMEQVAEPFGILAKTKKSVSVKQTGNLKGQVAEPIGNLEEAGMDEVAETTGLGCRNDTARLQKRTPQVAEPVCTTLYNPTINTLEEPKTTGVVANAPTPVSLDLEETKVKEEQTTSSLDSKENQDAVFDKVKILDMFCKSYTGHLTPEQKVEARQLALDPNFEPKRTTPGVRVQAAIQAVQETGEEIEIEW